MFHTRFRYISTSLHLFNTIYIIFNNVKQQQLLLLIQIRIQDKYFPQSIKFPIASIFQRVNRAIHLQSVFSSLQVRDTGRI